MKVYEIPLRFVKSFLIDYDKGYILVDAGTPGSGKRIAEFLNSKGVKLDYVVFTHTHPDHIGGAYELRNYTKAKFAIDANGVDYLREGKIREPVLHSAFLKVVFALGRPFFFKKFSGVKEDLILKEGELVEGVEVLRTPGHTNDSISLYLPSINSVIVGDTLQGTNKGLKYPSIYENLEELIKSVEKIKSLKPSFVYVSHGKSGSTFLV
ncbi:MBL fold metallo-hydrolase [Acidianus hospitalis]|jgi:glyoxylase-like metal-dependent hydrolase (beta-lactamase superfamily II)|uniref:MBL fold metallo-hydrolase n=1 Tax=Acidianus hospitalis TaxID=563177 RepID=A0A2T9XC44_9CREN|nr:MBL fold metallo-hydrolase [Acidianus hospitalis]